MYLHKFGKHLIFFSFPQNSLLSRQHQTVEFYTYTHLPDHKEEVDWEFVHIFTFSEFFGILQTYGVFPPPDLFRWWPKNCFPGAPRLSKHCLVEFAQGEGNCPGAPWGKNQRTLLGTNLDQTNRKQHNFFFGWIRIVVYFFFWGVVFAKWISRKIIRLVLGFRFANILFSHPNWRSKFQGTVKRNKHVCQVGMSCTVMPN